MNLMLVAVGCVFLYVFTLLAADDFPSLFGLEVSGGIVVGLWCLLYIPRTSFWSIAGVLFLLLYQDINSTKHPYSPVSMIFLIGCGLAVWIYWFTLGTAKVSEDILKRLNALQRRINSVEAKIDRLGREERRKQRGYSMTEGD
jgi:hypothetical protein